METDLARQSVRDQQRVLKFPFLVEKVRDVSRIRRSRFILETLEVGLDLVAIDLDLDLGRERNLGPRGR